MGSNPGYFINQLYDLVLDFSYLSFSLLFCEVGMTVMPNFIGDGEDLSSYLNVVDGNGG